MAILLPWRSLFVSALLVLAVMLTASSAFAGSTINVLWYTGGTEASGPGTYEANIGALAAGAPGAPGGNTWNVDFWTGGAMPSGTWNVLVVASPEGYWTSYPDYSALNAAVSGITWGSRLMLTGQDADWHYQNYPGPGSFDGPQGFLYDSINWAGSGTGLGLVALGMDGNGGGCYGGALLGLTGYNVLGCGTDNVVIPTAYATYPINTNLTSAGLSGWGTSAHVQFANLSSMWTGINVDGNVCGTTGACNDYVTIVTNGGGGGITTPEPGTLALLGTGLLGVVGMIRRKF